MSRYSKNRGLGGWLKRSRRRHNRLPAGLPARGKLDFGLKMDLNDETKKGILIIFLFVIAALSILGLFDLSGQLGKVIALILAILVGDVKWLIPVLLGLLVYALLREEKYQLKLANYLGAILLIAGLAGLFHLKYDISEVFTQAKAGLGGGYLGGGLDYLLLRLMGFWGTLVVTAAVFFIGLLLTFETSIWGIMWPLKLLQYIYLAIKQAVDYLLEKWAERRQAKAEPDYEEEAAVDYNQPEEAETEAEVGAAAGKSEVPQFIKTSVGGAPAKAREETLIPKPKKFGKKIELPLNLLTSRSGKPTSGDIKANQEIIRRTLANFGINVDMGEVNVGPTVTQYTLHPAEGMKLSRIVNLNSDLALALAAHPVRIEAPIPGKSLVGIEIPNQSFARVTMSEMLNSREFKERTNNLYLALGKDVSGKPIFAQLDKMPHLLIAGATGSGKSVCINSVIVSLLYQNSPDELKFILVDPKRVELPVFNNIPYLLTPVLTDVKKTINALKWCIVEMEKRFELLSKLGKRNIASYNQTAGEKLPYIIFIIDELADLMATAGNDMEAGIVRLAQMARAVGIHLILATQRPSVEVITGLIKANIPARVAFSVASLVDSRTILDSSGAEKLVGRGDMLYLGPDITKPRRIQGVYLSDAEINNVINFIKNQGQAEYLEELNGQTALGGSGPAVGFSDSEDPLLSEAMEIIRQNSKASASLLQRRLKLGYARAARILDILEERGIIGPADGAKPREIFLDQLGGVGAVEFAAREHDLEGELRPMSDEEETEPSFTAFTRTQDEDAAKNDSEEEEEEVDADNEEAEEPPQAAQKHKSTKAQKQKNNLEEDENLKEEKENLEEDKETEIEEESAALEEDKNNKEEEDDEEEEEEVRQQKHKNTGAKKSGKSYFSDDEWT